ncbi:hypothetical protein C8J56DRAFT_927884 [Mycena floridula]|nr:hypothetical protein C8J56DRAFT_927884 [Mycena floridula]
MSVPESQPDTKTRRYDRQLRLWAATGQSRLENAKILMLSGSATATSILKNLVLPGIGSFTIQDSATVTPEDAGNNFFLEAQDSVGKNRAEEAVRLLGELNDGVQGIADMRDTGSLLESSEGAEYFGSFTIIITHNLPNSLLEKLSKVLWDDERQPILVVVTSAGFLAEFGIQCREHCVIESHSETLPSLRIDKPFPELLEHAMKLDLAAMDPTDHGHVPYVVILVRALEDWKKQHNNLPPSTSAEKAAFKASIRAMRFKDKDEENFDEAEAQAYRCWGVTGVPSEVKELLDDPAVLATSEKMSPDTATFVHLLSALRAFTQLPPHVLPLSSTLPDMKANTESYVQLQRIYKEGAERDKAVFKGLLEKETSDIDSTTIESFVKNCHAVKMMKGKRWGVGEPVDLAGALESNPKTAATHLGLAALRTLMAKGSNGIEGLSRQALTAEALAMLPPGTVLPEEEWGVVVGELIRAPTADLPTTAAFLGGLVAQEVIKMVTKQYLPIQGVCVVDLVDCTTGVL